MSTVPNLAIAADALVSGAVRQIQQWILRTGEFFRFIPGYDKALFVLNAVLSVGLNYIDESVVGYIFMKKRQHAEGSAWHFAKDGVVLYAQNWKGVLKTSAIAVACIWAFTIAVFVPLILFGLLIGKFIAGGAIAGTGWIGGAIAALIAYVLTTLLKRALLDPILTIVMVREFVNGVQEITPDKSLEQKLMSVSSKFKELVNKAEKAEFTTPNSGQSAAQSQS